MPALHPRPEQQKAFIEDTHDGPIVMVNLLKFRDQAAYGEGDPEFGEAISGADAYARYGAEVVKLSADPDIGVQFIFLGQAKRSVIGDGDWDSVALAKYPSRMHMARMLADARYQAALRHRTAGLLHQDLIETLASLS
ncbi:MAG: DUF1330 domain-containing protein [Pseudomonadota bacterium]